MIFNLHKQKPRPKVTPLLGYLAVGNGEAQFFSPDHKLLAEMSKPEMMWAGAKGIMMRGFEPNGHDREGNQKYIYQEWFLRYPEES